MQIEKQTFADLAVQEYAGFRYYIYEKDGRLYARPTPGQRATAANVKHCCGAVEAYLQETV